MARSARKLGATRAGWLRNVALAGLSFGVLSFIEWESPPIAGAIAIATAVFLTLGLALGRQDK
jgi:hypothetical protein